MNRDSNAAIEERVKDLLSRLNLDEKIAQLGSVFAQPLMEDGKFSPEKAEKILKNGIGHISAIAMNSGLPPEELAAFANEIQEYLIRIPFHSCRCIISFT